ncbi:MAG: hypothetical protein AABX01_02925 [Candidatus Micrarchaeota archaeon]
MKVVLYSDNSAKSTEVRKYLQMRSIIFEEVDTKSVEGRQRLLKRTQQNGIPAIELVRNHSIHIFVGSGLAGPHLAIELKDAKSLQEKLL